MQTQNADLQKQLDESAQRGKDLELILSHYLPEGLKVDDEIGRITRAGHYEPVRSAKPSPEREVVANRKARAKAPAKTLEQQLAEESERQAPNGNILAGR